MAEEHGKEKFPETVTFIVLLLIVLAALSWIRLGPPSAANGGWFVAPPPPVGNGGQYNIVPNNTGAQPQPDSGLRY